MNTTLQKFCDRNGAAFEDKIENGKVHDERRINYLKEHFSQALRAIEDGVRLKDTSCGRYWITLSGLWDTRRSLE